MVRVNFLGRLGNNMFQYCFGRILATELGYKLVSPLIDGFAGTQENVEGKLIDENPLKLDGHIVDLKDILHNQQDRQIVLNGCFQRYEYYKNYKTEIRKWMDINYHDVGQTENDIIMHVRLGDNVTTFDTEHPFIMPLSYYEKALSSTSYDKLYICSDPETIDNEYIRQFDKYDPIILRGGMTNNRIDLRTIKSFSKIIISQSTFSWWGAFLSNASEIFVPVPNRGTARLKNEWSIARPDIALFVDDEERYKYIKQYEDGWQLVNLQDIEER